VREVDLSSELSSLFFWITLQVTNFLIWLLTDPRSVEFFALVTLLFNIIIFFAVSRFLDSGDEQEHDKE